jgi:alkaline phosphatase
MGCWIPVRHLRFRMWLREFRGAEEPAGRKAVLEVGLKTRTWVEGEEKMSFGAKKMRANPALKTGLLILLLAVLSSSIMARSKNLIVLIPDGCSASIQTLARWYKGEPLILDDMVVGAQSTYMVNSVVTGSAAAATAFASGVKTTARFIGVAPRPEDMLSHLDPADYPDAYSPLATVLEGAKLMGKSVGLVSTSRITHATPASYAAHIQDRGWDNEIMEHLVYQNLDVVFGGGKRHLLPSPAGRRTDGENLLQVLLNRGYDFVETREDMMAVTDGPVWGMFSSSHMEADIDRAEFAPTEPSIAEMTAKALEILSQNPKGFFIMIEGSQVDWAGHANDPIYMVTDMLAFDEAVQVAVDFAEAEGNTAVVAFPDHNTGALSLGNTASDGSYTSLQIEDMVGPLTGMKISAYGVARKIGDDLSHSNIKSQVEEWWGLTITDEDVDAILALTDAGLSLDYAMGQYLSAAYTYFGWTTHGHTGEDVPVWAHGRSKPSGLLENTELAEWCAKEMGFRLEKIQGLLYVDCDDAFPSWGLDTTDSANPVLVVGSARLPISKDLLYLGGKSYQLQGIVVLAPATGKVYVPWQAVNMIR